MSKFADALAAGYSKQEIVAFLRDRPGYDARINEALSSGYSEDEIVDHLHRQEFKAINPSATDEDLNYLVNDSIKTARKPRQTKEENIEERVKNRMNAGSSRTGAEQATVFDLNLEEKLRQRRNGLDASVRGDIGALGMKENQNWRDANQKLRQDAGRERTWGEAAQDVGVQLLEGGQNISGAIPDLVAPDSEWAQFHKKAANFWNSKQSEPIKARAQLAGQAIGQAGEDGVIAQVVEAASQYWDDPVLASRFVVTNLPSMVPGIAAAKLAQAGALARGATAARAMTAGVVAAGGVNAGLNAGGARGEAFEDIKQTLIKQGMDERHANEIAKRESIVPAMVGGATGAFSGSTGLERAFAGGIGRPLASGLVELAGEQAEEVLPKVTTNLVAGRYDDRSPGQDVGRTMVETAIGSAPGAALASGMEAFGGGDTQGGTPKKPVAEGPNDDNVSGQYVDDAVPVGGQTPGIATHGMPPSAGTTERPLAQLSEFEQFVQSEREDIARRRIGMVERQAASQQAEIEQRIPSEVETKDAQVLAARQRTDQEQRLADLERAMRSPNPMATFAELRTSKNQPVLPEDSAIIKRRMGQAEAFQGDYAPGVEPSLPDGGMSDMVPERKPVAQSAPAGGNFAAIDNALANGFKPQGKALVHPKTGKKINLNVAEREYLAGLKRGGNQPVTSPGAEDGDTDQGGQVSQVASRGVEGASAELPGSGRATQAGVSGGLPGDGGRAAVPGGSDGSPVPAGTAGAQGVNEFDVSTRTDEQLANLVKAGKPGWREAAIAEVSKRSKENAASTDDGQAASVDAAAHAAATSPTNDLAEPSEGQKKAGNYAKGHTRVAGLDLSIENPEGSTRSGKDPGGKPWSVTMKSHYGYIKGTVGKDKDHLDVFVKPGTAEDWNGAAYVIDQVRPDTGAFDEHKIMLGFADIDEAKAAYRENYAKGWAGLKTISATPMQELKDWIKDGDTTKPFHKAKLKAEVEKAKGKTQELVEATTLDEFQRAIEAGKRSHFDYSGADGTTIWIEETKNGWVVKEREDDRGDGGTPATITKGGAYPWSKDFAVRSAMERAAFRFSQWRPVTEKQIEPDESGRLVEKERATKFVKDEPTTDQGGMTLEEAKNMLGYVRGKLGEQGRVKDDRLLSRERELVKLVKELEADQEKASPERFEIRMRAAAHDTERPGDVMTSAGRWVDFDTALGIAREAVDSGEVKPFPAQINMRLDVRMADADRLLAALKPKPKAEDTSDFDALLDSVLDQEFGVEEKPAKRSETVESLLAGAGLSASGFEDWLHGEGFGLPIWTGPKTLAEAMQSVDLARQYVKHMREDDDLSVKPKTTKEKLADEVKKARAPRQPSTKPRTAGEAAKSAAKNTGSGLANAAKGLNALFATKPGTLGSGPVFNEETYAQAKPFFEMALADLKMAMTDARDVLVAVVRGLIDNGLDRSAIKGMSPYLERFVKEKLVSSKEEGNGDNRGNEVPGDGSLGEVEAGGDGGTESGGVIRKKRNGRRSNGAPGAGDASETGVSDARSGGSGPQDLHPETAGVNTPAINFTITADVRLGQGGEVEKFNDNLAAIRALKQIERDNRRATPDEQRILARYVGWGGLANAFANPKDGSIKKGWEPRVNELAGLLTKAELNAARRSTLNAHYTSETVVRAMWKAAERLGFKGGTVLEPSAGTGNFLGMAPAHLRGNTKFIAVEYDSLTARITKALYPQSTVLHAGFQDVPLQDGGFTMAIGNPPFGKESLNFRHKPELRGVSIHNQFFQGALDAVAPGGLEVMVVSRYLMDAQDTGNRARLAVKGDLIGAIRLPDTAFQENARTEVVTDILFIKRREPADEAAMEAAVDAFLHPPHDRGRKQNLQQQQDHQRWMAMIPDWVKTGTVRDPLGGEDITVNSYFIQNKGMILGTLERSGSMQHGKDVTVRMDKGEDLGVLLDEAIQHLPENVAGLPHDVVQATLERHEAMSASLTIAITGQEPGDLRVDEDGNLVQVYEREAKGGGYEFAKRTITKDSPWHADLIQDGDGKWGRLSVVMDDDGNPVKVMKNGKPTKRNLYEREIYDDESKIPARMRVGETRFARLRDMVKLRDLLKQQLSLESTDANTEEMEGNRAKLKDAYDAFVKEHGFISKHGAIVSEMPDGALVLALELSHKKEKKEWTGEMRTVKKKDGTTSQQKIMKTVRPESVTPAPILTGRVLVPYAPPNKADSPTDALFVTLSERGRVDMERIGELLGLDADGAAAKLHDELDEPLAFFDPETEQWETRGAYLTGLVKRKLEAAKAAGLTKNIAALEKVQPEPWGAENVTPRLGAGWIPTDVYARFVEHLVGGSAKVQYSKVSNSFSMAASGVDRQKSREEWGTDAMSAASIVERLMNSDSLNVYWEDSDGKRHLDKEATVMVQLKASQILNDFSEWIFADSDQRNRLTGIFNEKFNTRVGRQHDGSFLTLPGKVPDAIIEMRRHQKNAIWRGISERFMLLDHVVGAGKTFTAIARVMERRRLGLSKKPMIVVPNHLVEQFAVDVYRLYPGAKVLAAGKADFEKSKRRRLFAKIATGDWDVVIVPHSSFGFIDIANETSERFFERDLKQAYDAIDEAWDQAKKDGTDDGRRKPFGVKEAERIATALEERRDAMRNRPRDRLLTFEQLGVDDVTIDEAHEFKNLFYTSRLTGVRGLGNKTGSGKALDLYGKVRYLAETPTGSVTFMTGTPISNSAVEMFTLMRYLAADELSEYGLSHFDAWRAQYVDVDTKFEPNEAGQLKEVKRLGRSWSNMRSLMELYYSFTDAVTIDDIKKWYAEDNDGKPFPVPKVKGGNRQNVVVQPTPEQVRILEDVLAGFDGLEGIADAYDRNKERLRLMDRARKVSISARVADPGVIDSEGGKLGRVVDEVKRLYDKWTPDRGTQLVFLDRSIPKSKGDDKLIKFYDATRAAMDKATAERDEETYQELADALAEKGLFEDTVEAMREAQKGGWNAYQQIKDDLVAKGIPANEIRFIQEANTDEQKKALFEAVNEGSVRVLIGSTPRMGAGTNVQERLVGLHHVDVTWKPSDIEQREGRIIRFGNSLLEKYGIDNFEVEILAYATERTVDAKMWSLNATKLKTINAIRKYDGSFNMEFDDSDSVSMAELAALASGNPLLLERVQLMAEIDRLELLAKAHRRKAFALDDQISSAKRTIATAPARIEQKKARAAVATKAVGEAAMAREKASIVVEGQTYTDMFDAMEAAKRAIETQKGDDEKARFSISLNGQRFSNKAMVDETIQDAFGDVDPFAMDVMGKVHNRRIQAARDLSQLAEETFSRLALGKTETMDIGQFMGFKMEAQFEREETRSGGETYTMTVSIVDGDGLTVASMDAHNNTSKFGTPKIKPVIENLEYTAKNQGYSLDEQMLANAKEELPRLEANVGKPFEQQDELKEKQARLEEVTKILAADGKKVHDDTRLSRSSTGYRSGIPIRDAQAVVDVFRTVNRNAPDILVLEDVKKAPDALLAEIKKAGAMEDVEGAFHDGKIYVFPQHMDGPERVAEVLTHEGRHFAFRAMKGKALDSILMDIYNTNDRIRMAARAKQKELGLASTVEAVEEVLADMDIKELQGAKGWKQLVAHIRLKLREFVVALRRAGLDGVASWLQDRLNGWTDADVAAMLKNSDRFVRSGRGDGSGGTRMSRTADTIEAGKQQEQPKFKVAIRLPTGEVVPAAPGEFVHSQVFNRLTETRGEMADDAFAEAADFGFVDATGKYYTRDEATAALGREAEGETLGDNALPKPTPTNPDIRFSRATGNGTLRAKRGPIDTPLRIATQRLGADKLTGGAWEGLQRIAGAYVPEVVKAGMVDDYGLSAGYTDARSMMFSHQRQGLRGVQRLMDRVAGLSRAESAILYQAAAYEPDPGAVDAMIAGLPEDSQAALREIKQLVHDLGEEEVMLDLLDAETFERNEWAYLHRSYARWELGLSDQEKAARQKAKSIWGDTFRMRGMKMDINPESIHAPATWFNGEMKGKKVTVLKKARADGKFSRAMVVGAIPEKYSTWTVDGDWEIIDAKKGNFVVRRDYTPEERQDMGEIEDIRFATVKTLQHMMHNVEVAKFFEWVAATEAADEVPEGGIIADPSESLTRAFKKDEWVLVPDSKLTGTSVKRYGALAGKYVPGPVWNDIRQLANRHYAPFGKTYAAILKAWKISKTALSPAVHMNNVMANLVMADWHDVEATNLLAAIKAMANDDRALIDAFEDNGGSEGMYAISELQREQLQPIIDALEEELAGAIQGEGMVGAIAAVRILHDARLADLLKTTGPWREAWEAFRLGKAYKVPAKLAGKMIDLYQEEDTVFRLAAFIKAKEDGLTDKEAGKFARKSFLDYQINAPWIQAMRNTAFPFISFTYRALPMLLDTAAHKPWKLLKLGLTMGALNALFTAMAGGDDDEDRKYLPVEKSGRVLGFVAPKLIRMPWNGEHDAPVFLDIRRWIPVGDIVDIGQEHSAIPLLPSMMPGGPLVVLGEVVFNTSAFTGKKITKSTDTGLSDALGHGDLSMERYVKVVDHLYKAFMPNIMGLPGTYATAKVADAATGKTDSFGREYSTASAMASGFGVKVAAYPKDVGKLSNDLDYLAKEREIADNIRSLERQKKRKGISREEYRDALKQEMEKLRRAEEERAQ